MAVTVTSDDLGVYLGTEVDNDRATQLIELATALCSSILSPVPDTAKPVVLSVAARAYVNPQAVQQQSVGPYQVSYGGSQYSGSVGGLYLTRKDEATLRRLGGGGGAFDVDLLADFDTTGLEVPDETTTP